MRRRRTYDIITIALITAIIVICSWIIIPFSVIPFTMQTFAVFMAGLLLGPAKGTVCVVLYLLLGVVGLPVFSSFQCGPSAIMGTTGGFLLGFVLIPLIGGIFDRKFNSRTIFSVAGQIIGLICCYATGVLWYAYFYGNSRSAEAIIAACVLPYIIPDIIKCILAVVVSKKVSVVIKGRII